MGMAEKEYIEREAFLTQKREQYCKDCARRKGMRNGKYKTLYEIGEAPCRACEIDDVLNDVEDFPAADVRPVVTCAYCKYNNACLTQAFVEEASRVPFDRNTFFCADGKRADDA